jgi:acetoacetyl-CoA synthetase
MPTVNPGQLLWQPSPERVEQSGITQFCQWVDHRYNKKLNDYAALLSWSITEAEQFWEAIWRYYEIAPDQHYQYVRSADAMPNTRWFEGANINFAEYLLRQAERGDCARTAIFAESECRAPVSINWLALREQVVSLAAYLRSIGVVPGDRVVAYLPISIEASVAMLACISIGAVWSCCSPDFGEKGVLERFEQIEPKVIFAVSGYKYNGKSFDRSEPLNHIVASLASLTELIYLPWLDAEEPSPVPATAHCRVRLWQEAIDKINISYADFKFELVPFNSPIWIMYTSGTTGIPKGIVHSQGGVLLECVKYAWLHDDLNPQSVKFFYTTTGWAMFNILLGGMMAGAAIVVYDGCPTFPDNNRLWDIAERYGVSYFGANPTYINSLAQANYCPRANHQLESVKTIALTGSPSAPETFAWFYEHVHHDLHVVSMSGGTDICAAFVGGAVTLPVYAGEIQCACLGVEVCVYDQGGNELPTEQDGELVVKQAMPSMPLYLWGDQDGKRFWNSYFDYFPGVWRQGDLIRVTQHGGYIISGRSDSTLNRSGIRIGTAEIYRCVESISNIKDSLIVSLELPGARFFMPLFVVLNEGEELSELLRSRIKKTLAQHCSPRHVPDEIYAIDEVPYTLTGKKLEVPVKKLLIGLAADKAMNKGAILNPQAMEAFVEIAGELQKTYLKR